MGLATIYRQLEKLEAAGAVHKVNTEEGALYQYCGRQSPRPPGLLSSEVVSAAAASAMWTVPACRTCTTTWSGSTTSASIPGGRCFPGCATSAPERRTTMEPMS